MKRKIPRIVFVTDDRYIADQVATFLQAQYPNKVYYEPVCNRSVQGAYDESIPMVQNADAVFLDLLWLQGEGWAPKFPGLNYILKNLRKNNYISKKTRIGVLTRLGRTDDEVIKICKRYDIPIEHVGSPWLPEGRAAIAAVLKELGVEP